MFRSSRVTNLRFSPGFTTSQSLRAVSRQSQTNAPPASMKTIRTALPFNKGWGAVGFLLDAEREFLDLVLLSSHLEERTDELEENEETKKRKTV